MISEVDLTLSQFVARKSPKSKGDWNLQPINLPADAERRYLETLERRDAIRDAWERAGSPIVTDAGGEDPLLKALRLHELLVEKLAIPLRKAHAGPKASAVVSSSIGKSPAIKLRRVQ